MAFFRQPGYELLTELQGCLFVCWDLREGVTVTTTIVCRAVILNWRFSVDPLRKPNSWIRAPCLAICLKNEIANARSGQEFGPKNMPIYTPSLTSKTSLIVKFLVSVTFPFCLFLNSFLFFGRLVCLDCFPWAILLYKLYTIGVEAGDLQNP